jgi:ribosome-associated protein
MKIIEINSEYIKLGQLLKLSGIADSGIHAKVLILNEEVNVNSEVETRRGRKIYNNDIVEVMNEEKIKVKVI